MHETFLKVDSFRRVRAVDLERGDNFNACNSILSGGLGTDLLS